MSLKLSSANSKAVSENAVLNKTSDKRPNFSINEEFKARRFVAVVQRKKEFTKIKKRILMVGLKVISSLSPVIHEHFRA